MGSEKLNIAIFTGNELRHEYFASVISQKFRTRLVVFEQKANIHKKINYGSEGNKLIEKHFNSRLESEKKYFINYPNLNADNILRIKSGDLNSEKIMNILFDREIQYILLFGSSIVQDEILKLFHKRIFNLHLGLTPYYRGSGTNFWPLVDELPECVGSTIHLAVKKIDAGGILKQLRPKIKITDGPHDIGNKVIIESIKKIPYIVNHYNEKKIIPTIIDTSSGRLCLRKDLTLESIKKLYNNFNNKMIEKYLNNQFNRISKYPIIN